METSLRLIYTYNIRGDLDLLARLFTFIQALKQDLPQAERSFLIDLGKSCALEIWHCNITAGRSTLLILDAMGYDVVNGAVDLTEKSREELAQHTMLHLVDKQTAYQQGNVRFQIEMKDNPEGVFCINLTPTNETGLINKNLYLYPVNTAAGQVGVIQLYNNKIQFDLHTIPPNTRINTTIAGAVEFIISEARYVKNQHNS